jgi:hypothetical protein
MSDGESNTLKYVGIGCLVVGLLGMCGVGACVTCVGAGAGGIMAAVAAPAEAVHGFMREVRTGGSTSAYARMNASYRAANSQADFDARLAAFPALTAATDATIAQRNVNGTTAVMSGTLDGTVCAAGGTGCAVPISFTLHQEGEAWYIDTVTIEGQLF